MALVMSDKVTRGLCNEISFRGSDSTIFLHLEMVKTARIKLAYKIEASDETVGTTTTLKILIPSRSGHSNDSRGTTNRLPFKKITCCKNLSSTVINHHQATLQDIY